MIYLTQIGILLALLITLGGLLALRRAEEDKAQQRLLLYLLVVGDLMLLALFVAIQMGSPQDNWLFHQVRSVLTPALIGVLALTVLHGKQLAAMSRGAQLLALLLTVGLAGVVITDWSTELAYFMLPSLAALVLGWAVGRRFQKTAVFIAFLLLIGLNLLSSMPTDAVQPLFPEWLIYVFFTIFPIFPGLMVVVSAVLLTNSLKSRHIKNAFIPTTLALGLIGYLAYSIFWASVWDNTSDGITGGFLMFSSALVAVGAGMVMAVALTGWRRSAGLLFAILVPLLLLQSFQQGWQVSYHDLTEARAERIGQALADYRGREGVYPPTLSALTPRYLLRVPQPVQLQGETWCYQGGDDFYRLGAFYREYFSTPVELQVYATAGEPDSVWACEGQLAAMKKRYYSPMEDPAASQQTLLPTPLPPSEVAMEAEALTPLLAESDMVWGSWSPDGAYFLLGQGDGTGNVTLSFLDGRDGELCTAAGSYSVPPFTDNLRKQHAWLPDGQLLLLNDAGEIVLLRPCATDLQKVMPRSQEIFTELMAHDEQNGRLLVRSANQYWIFDSRMLSWQLIPDVTPNPYDLHWDNAAWQPDGKLLAISRLNGRDASEGSTLYIIAGESGQVIHTLPQTEASDQSAPHVDWLLPQELMLSGSSVLRILDFSTEPPQSTDVMVDIFGLDLDFPNEVSSHGWEVDWENGSYIMTVQANHPRNQALYLYRSVTGAVEVYNETPNLLLLFPDGQMQQITKPKRESSELDEFILIDVEGGQIHPPLTITGHTPRDNPRLSMTYLAESEQLAVASSQGISLHNLPDGAMSHFWTLTGQGFAPSLLPAPDDSALVAVQHEGGVYWLPLR